MSSDPRWTYQYKVIRRRLFATATTCALCGYLLDRDAPPRSRWAPSIDHIIPIAEGGLPFEPTNLRVVHYGENASRGATQGNRARGSTARHPTTAGPLPWHSRDW